MQVEDEDLMLQAKAGRIEALEELIQRYERRLYGFLMKWLRNSVDAEEAFQDIWLRVFESRTRYEAKAKFSTWIYRIATNLCIDRGRKLRPSQTLSDAMAEASDAVVLPDKRRGPEAEAERSELSSAIRRSVEALPDGQRAVFALAEGEGLSYGEVSEILGIPVGTVKSRMHTACGTLQLALAEYR